MIIHIALFKWKPKTTNKQIGKMFKDVKVLQYKVPGIVHIYCGKNYHKKSKGLTHGIVILAKNKKALENYRMHVNHILVAKIIDEHLVDGVGFDFSSK